MVRHNVAPRRVWSSGNRTARLPANAFDRPRRGAENWMASAAEGSKAPVRAAGEQSAAQCILASRPGKGMLRVADTPHRPQSRSLPVRIADQVPDALLEAMFALSGDKLTP